MSDRKRGFYKKFTVYRNDGGSAHGAKHHGCEYFVLDLTHDAHAKAALLAYADSCKTEYPLLSHDIKTKVIPNEIERLEREAFPERYDVGACPTCGQSVPQSETEGGK